MPAQDKNENFVQLLTESQNRLYGYIYTMIGDHSRSKDVLQETNLVLWRKYDELQKVENFKAWSFTVCKFQVMAYLRDKKRDRLLLDPELADMISETAETTKLSTAEVLFAETQGLFLSLPLPNIMEGLAQIMLPKGHPMIDAFRDPEAEFFIR